MERIVSKPNFFMSLRMLIRSCLTNGSPPMIPIVDIRALWIFSRHSLISEIGWSKAMSFSLEKQNGQD